MPSLYDPAPSASRPIDLSRFPRFPRPRARRFSNGITSHLPLSQSRAWGLLVDHDTLHFSLFTRAEYKGIHSPHGVVLFDFVVSSEVWEWKFGDA